MIKILFAIDGLRAGGKERRFLALLKQLILSKKFQCVVVIFNSDVHYKEVFDLEVKLNYLIRKKSIDFSVLRELYLIAKEIEPDIIHCWDTLSTLYAIPTAKMLRIKLITNKITDAPVNYRKLTHYGIASEICFYSSDLILSNSTAGIKAYGVSNRKSQVIYNGFDFSRLAGLKPREELKTSFSINEDFIISMVASFNKNKDFRIFLEAAKIVRVTNNNIAFVCVGDGLLRNELEEEFGEPGIYFTGRCNDVESIMSISDTGVLITNVKVHGEGISNSLMEFMALGVPVIASNNGGNAELVEHNRSGSILPENDPQLLAQLIIDHIRRPNHYKSLGLSGSDRIKSHFSIERMVYEYRMVYQDLLR